jgi:hypothetical protein
MHNRTIRKAGGSESKTTEMSWLLEVRPTTFQQGFYRAVMQIAMIDLVFACRQKTKVGEKRCQIAIWLPTALDLAK